jgi:hypothetical protein
MGGGAMSAPRTKCIVCHRCLCSRCHPKDPCEAIDRGRRVFLLGALVLPVAPKLVVPPPVSQATLSYGSLTLTFSDVVSSWEQVRYPCAAAAARILAMLEG